MESLVEVLQRLEKKGYGGQCRAESKGVRFLSSDTLFAAEKVQVDELIRIEGTSSPDEESTVYALSSPDQTLRGTLCVAFGPELPQVDADIVTRLKVKPGSR